jgi:hypothetical protein
MGFVLLLALCAPCSSSFALIIPSPRTAPASVDSTNRPAAAARRQAHTGTGPGLPQGARTCSRLLARL